LIVLIHDWLKWLVWSVYTGEFILVIIERM
jgi:hypothetical protein